jgi:hypothetical protein
MFRGRPPPRRCSGSCGKGHRPNPSRSTHNITIPKRHLSPSASSHHLDLACFIDLLTTFLLLTLYFLTSPSMRTIPPSIRTVLQTSPHLAQLAWLAIPLIVYHPASVLIGLLSVSCSHHVNEKGKHVPCNCWIRAATGRLIQCLELVGICVGLGGGEEGTCMQKLWDADARSASDSGPIRR